VDNANLLIFYLYFLKVFDFLNKFVVEGLVASTTFPMLVLVL